VTQQIAVDKAARAEEHSDGSLHEVLSDLAYQRLAIVNVVYVGDRDAGQWVLIDAGVMGSAEAIRGAVQKRYGGRPPAAIVMTHAHFDHVGALAELAREWRVPVYAHRLELPYLDGRSSYPPPDPSVGGGMMALMSPLYPRGPIDVGEFLQPLPDDGSVPSMPGWRCIHTPGHCEGHVSFWRDRDRTLVVGDAFVTTNQESAYSVAVQKPEMHGPPMYYTQDWERARDSVQRLAQLQPELVITGHGRALQGELMREALTALGRRFDEVAVPEHGRYVGTPARADESGVTYVPPEK
jgi:glyoxylase-like metal-dependent hydrolase (beta-lactamase superfamily II)